MYTFHLFLAKHGYMDAPLPATEGTPTLAQGVNLPPYIQVSLSSAQLDFAWTSISGKVYDLESTASLSNPDGNPYNDSVTSYVNIAVSSNGIHELNGIASSGPVRFFRVIEK